MNTSKLIAFLVMIICASYVGIQLADAILGNIHVGRLAASILGLCASVYVMNKIDGKYGEW